MRTDKTAEARDADTQKRSSWEPVKLIISKIDPTIAARVSRLHATATRPHPVYSYELGVVDAEGIFKRFFKPVIKVNDGKIDLVPINREAKDEVSMEAEIYIIEETQKREEELQLQAKRAKTKPKTSRK